MVELDYEKDSNIPMHLQHHFRQYLPATDVTRRPSHAYKARSRVQINGKLASSR